MEWFTPDKNKADWFLRIGLAVVLLYSAVTKFTATEQVSGLFGTLIGISNAGFTIFMGIVLTVFGLLLLFNTWTQPVGTLLSVFFAVAIISGLVAGGLAFSVGPAIWKDFGLLGASLAVAFYK